MDFFKIVTPVTYWVLTIVWIYIFVFYIRKLNAKKTTDSFLRILLIILAIDAFRTLFESLYFGTRFSSISGILPRCIYDFLIQPQIVFVPKLINLIASLLVFGIIVRKWLPQETDRIESFNALVAEKTKRIEASNKKYKSEAKSSTEIANRYHHVIINSPFPIMIYAEDGEVLSINNSWEKITGYTLEEINTISKWTQKAYGKNARDITKHINKLYKNESALKQGEFTITTKTGNHVIWEFSSAPLEKLSNGRKMVISTAVDVTDKKQTERICKESEKKYKNLVKSIPLPLCLVNTEGENEYINDRFIDTFAYTLKDIPTANEWWIKAFPDQQYRTSLLNDWSIAIEKAKKNNTDIESKECRVRCKTGKDLTVIVSGITIGTGFLVTFLDVTKSKQAEESIKNINENLEQSVKERTKELNNKAVKLEKSQQALTYLLEDVNDIKKQLLVSNDKLVDANKELEAFSYSVSHDLKAPLRAVIGFSQILKEDFATQLDDESNRYINLIKDNAENMGTLINDLLSFSRMGRTVLKKTFIDLHEIAERVKNELVIHIKDRNLTINIMDMPKVKADEKLMYHVMLNLVSNAVKFTSKLEKAIIEIGCTNKDNNNIFFVKDNGVGFNMKYAEKVFAVFQRLHTVEEFPGTGIGLSIVQRIIYKHGGKIWVESEINKGTTFYFTLEITK